MAKQNEIVALSLNGGQVTRGFREALFDAAAREGVSVNEFVIEAAGIKLIQIGKTFPSVFYQGDEND